MPFIKTLHNHVHESNFQCQVSLSCSLALSLYLPPPISLSLTISYSLSLSSPLSFFNPPHSVHQSWLYLSLLWSILLLLCLTLHTGNSYSYALPEFSAEQLFFYYRFQRTDFTICTYFHLIVVRQMPSLGFSLALASPFPPLSLSLSIYIVLVVATIIICCLWYIFHCCWFFFSLDLFG